MSAGSRTPRFDKRRRRQVVLFLLALATILIVGDYLSYPALTTGNLSGAVPASCEDGIWLRYKWYFDEHSADDWQALLKRLKEERFRYAFFHVRGIIADGALRFHYEERAKKLIDRLRKTCPEAKVIAWVYIGTAPEYGGVDLSKESVRNQIVKETSWLLDRCGFDGVQLDYEFCANGDAGFLKLLQSVRQVVPAGKVLSVASPMWYPGVLWGWSDDYYRQVAQHCDQICVMCYDSFCYLPRAYVWLVEQNARHVSRDAAAAGNHCTVLLGIPTYEEGTAGHSNYSETVTLALTAARRGYAAAGTDQNTLRGVCIFAEYTTSPAEWAEYDRLWSSCHR